MSLIRLVVFKLGLNTAQLRSMEEFIFPVSAFVTV